MRSLKKIGLVAAIALTGLATASSNSPKVQPNISAPNQKEQINYCSVSKEEQLNPKFIYFGDLNGKNFKKAVSIDNEMLLNLTPEYQKIKDSKIERGTGKYWILASQAADRLRIAVTRYGQKSGVDLIVSIKYAQKEDLDLSELCDVTYPIWEQMERHT